MNSPGFERRAGAGRRHLASAFDDRLRESIAITEVIVRIDEWGHGLQIKGRQHFNALALRDKFLVLHYASLALRLIARRRG